jgi:hypothetical protein
VNAQRKVVRAPEVIGEKGKPPSHTATTGKAPARPGAKVIGEKG